MVFYAHSDSDLKKWQRLLDHLRQVASRCATFLEPFGFFDAGYLLGLTHDFGKYTREYQRYLQSSGGMLKFGDDEFLPNAKSQKGKIPHASAGARLIWDDNNLQIPMKILLAYPVACHHSGSEDLYNLHGVDCFAGRMRSAPAVPAAETEITEDIARILRAETFRKEFYDNILRMLKDDDAHFEFRAGLLLRLFSSALVDADRLDAAGTPVTPSPCRWSAWGKQFEDAIERIKSASPIDAIRRRISLQCRAAAERPSGAVYRLAVPTGGGKTLSGLRFAIAHAEKHGLKRIFYVAPLLSILEQNADVFRKCFRERGIVYECHSHLSPERGESEEHRGVLENWDAPVVCTTFVQMLNSMFSGENRHIRRFHMLANTVILFDEVQNIPLRMLDIFAGALHFITRKMGATVVLVSATQPPFQLKWPALPDLAENMNALLPEMKRVNVQVRDDIKTDEDAVRFFCRLAHENGSVLVVANTRKHVQQLFRLLENQDFSVFHLSTNMCPRHRKNVYIKIQDALDHPVKPVIVLSTSLIQAGVDLTFRSAVRYLCGLDSIVQTAGRCNRHKHGPPGDVYVLPNPPDVAPPASITQEIRAARITLWKFAEQPEVYGNEFLHPSLLEAYYRELYAQSREEMAYPIHVDNRSSNLLELLSVNKKSLEAFKQDTGREPDNRLLAGAYKTAGACFRAIEDFQEESVIVPYRGGKALIKALKNASSPVLLNPLLKKAQQYSVNVSGHVLETLRTRGGIHEIPCGVLCLDAVFYDPETGIELGGKRSNE